LSNTKGFGYRHFKPVKMKIGKPILPPETPKFTKNDIEAMTGKIMASLTQMLEEIK